MILNFWKKQVLVLDIFLRPIIILILIQLVQKIDLIVYYAKIIKVVIPFISVLIGQMKILQVIKL